MSGKDGWSKGDRAMGSFARDLDRKDGKAAWGPSAKGAFKDAAEGKPKAGAAKSAAVGTDKPQPVLKPGWAKGPNGPLPGSPGGGWPKGGLKRKGPEEPGKSQKK